MTSKTGTQTVTINILPNISRSKANQTMKLDKLIEYNVRNILLQKSCINETQRLVSIPLFLFAKALINVKASA